VLIHKGYFQEEQNEGVVKCGTTSKWPNAGNDEQWG